MNSVPLRIALIFLFFVAVVFAPWWCAVLLALVIATEGGAIYALPIGGALMDALFGAPILALGGFALIYTTVFSILAAVSFIIHRNIFD